MRTSFLCSLLFWATFSAHPVHASAQTTTAPKRLITDKDLFDFQWIGKLSSRLTARRIGARIDTSHLGMTGGSGGGALTNWTVTHTDRFRAAVSQRDISHWTSWWYTDDFLLFQPEWFKDAPFNVPDDFAKRSAIT